MVEPKIILQMAVEISDLHSLHTKKTLLSYMTRWSLTLIILRVTARMMRINNWMIEWLKMLIKVRHKFRIKKSMVILTTSLKPMQRMTNRKIFCHQRTCISSCRPLTLTRHQETQCRHPTKGKSPSPQTKWTSRPTLSETRRTSTPRVTGRPTRSTSTSNRKTYIYSLFLLAKKQLLRICKPRELVSK